MNSIAKKIAISVSLGLLLLTSGCFDTKEDYTLNPDGSGKVVHECTFQAVDLNADSGNEDSGKALTNAVREVLKQSKGVEAWRNVTFKTLEDGRLYFRGTAYFKNLSHLDIQNQTMLDLAWTKTADGNALITLRTNKSGSETSEGISIRPSKKSPPKNMTPEQLDKYIKQQRGKFQQSKPMFAGFFGTMKHAIVLHLPGKVVSHSNFTNDANGNLTILFSGAKMLEVMEKLVNDDVWCRAHSGTGFDDMQEKPVMDAEMNQFIFGEKAPVQAVVAPGTAPLFNYAAEVAAAKTEFALLAKALAGGASATDDAPEVLAAPANGGLRSVKVVGVRLVTESDDKRNLRPFNYDTGYTISLLVEFPGAVQTVTDKTAIEVATADDGTSLLPESDWDRKVHFPQLAKDKAAAILEFKLNLPSKNVNGLKELSGHLQYRVSSGTKELDLGLSRLTAGATGTNLDARIESIKEGWQKHGSQMMALHLNTNPDGLKAMSLVVDGTKMELRQNGYGGGMNSYNFTYECKTNFPTNGRLVAEVYDQVQTFEAPFKLENITLLGASLNAGK
ncbi:MAG: hypothetical protein WCK57_07465 [Verrucomicrobiae bacterium]